MRETFFMFGVITIVIKICAFVISTEGLRSGPQWRDLAASEKRV